MTKHNPIDASTYELIFEGLLESLEKARAGNAKDMQLLKDHGLSDSQAYGVGLGKDVTYKALIKRIKSDLEAAQQEADGFEGFDA